MHLKLKSDSTKREKKKTRAMRREGRQHGYVRNQPKSRQAIKRSEEDVGVRCDRERERGCCKPTNESKYRGRCRCRCRYCHLEPSSKSRGKTKGLRKHTSSDLLSSYRAYAWSLVVHHNPHHLPLLSITNSAVPHSSPSSYFISSFAHAEEEEEEEEDDDDDDNDDDDDIGISITIDDHDGDEPPSQTSTEEEEEVTEKEKELDVTQFISSSHDSDSWTTEILYETDLEDWCLVNEEII